MGTLTLRTLAVRASLLFVLAVDSVNRLLPLSLFLAILLSGISARAASIRTPNNTAPGYTYQLAFVTSGQRDGASANIEDYDFFVRGEANAANFGYVQGINWYAIASTALSDARTHAPVYAPVYAMDGWQIAPNATSFWGGANPGPYTDRNGVAINGNLNVWTGTGTNGYRYSGYTLGTDYPIYGQTNIYNQWLTASFQYKSTGSRLFALSEPLTVIGAGQAVPSRWYTTLPASQTSVVGQVGGGTGTVGGINFVLDQVGAGARYPGANGPRWAGTNPSGFLVREAEHLRKHERGAPVHVQGPEHVGQGDLRARVGRRYLPAGANGGVAPSPTAAYPELVETDVAGDSQQPRPRRGLAPELR